MFPLLISATEDLRSFCGALDPGELAAGDAAEAIRQLAEVERLAAGARIRLAKRVEDDDLVGRDGKRDAAEWLAERTGQSAGEARRDLECSKQLDDLPATDRALRDGELSPTQAHEVTDAASVDPHAEVELLDSARHEPVGELRRKAKRVKSAATDDDAKHRRARRRRCYRTGTDHDTGEGWIHINGPANEIAEANAILRPHREQAFKDARAEGRREGQGAYAYDGFLQALRSTGGGAGAAAKATILARADLSALVRGHTHPGETCEIDGLGPVPVAALRELLPDAAIELIVTDGRDAWNVTHLGRRANARQQAVLHWLGVRCTNASCGHTQHLQVDHNTDWAQVKVTELVNLDWLCPHCHRLKTHRGWHLVEGRGPRALVAADHPAHPANQRRRRPAA